jgi:hypothetical protein
VIIGSLKYPGAAPSLPQAANSLLELDEMVEGESRRASIMLKHLAPALAMTALLVGMTAVYGADATPDGQTQMASATATPDAPAPKIKKTKLHRAATKTTKVSAKKTAAPATPIIDSASKPQTN